MIRIKTKEDITLLREGGKRHAYILKQVAALVRPGISLKELNDATHKLIIEGGDTPPFLNYKPYGAPRPFPASVCISLNHEIVHGIPTEGDKVIAEGDVVKIDLGLSHQGMITDSAVTVVAGTAKPEVLKVIEHTREALKAGIKAAKGGNRVGDIGAAIERIAVAHGYGLVEELSGHGVGYDVHEDPYVPNFGEPGKGERLVPGMVIAIEPIFTLGDRHIVLNRDGWTYETRDGSIATHCEHTVLITKGDAEVLTIE